MPQTLTLSGLEQHLQELPLLPSVVAKLLSLDAKDEGYLQDVLALARSDPTLSLRLIQLANSGASAPASPISSLQQAVARIGAGQIGSLITSMAVMRVFVPTTAKQRALWTHAIETAVTARAIARTVPKLKLDPEQAYLCGLMHDIGRFVLFDAAPKELGQVDEKGWSTPQQLIDVERSVCGFDHAELGWHACKRWEMPKVVQEVVKAHHLYVLPRPLLLDHELATLIRVVQISDLFSMSVLDKPDVHIMKEPTLRALIAKSCFHPSWRKPPVHSADLARLVPLCFHESRSLAAVLGLTSPPAGAR